MKLRIIRALVGKEALRYWHNRPSLVLAALLVLVSVLVAVGHEDGPFGADNAPAVCYVLYWEEDAFVRHLAAQHETGLDIRVLPVEELSDRNGMIQYPGDIRRRTILSIQIRPGHWEPVAGQHFAPVAPPPSPPKYKVWYWYSEGRAEALLPFRDWFNAQMRGFYGNQPVIAEADGVLQTELGPILPLHRILTALVTAAVYLVCFHLNILITSEERERRVLLAQMLTPVSVGDVLAAKVCFYVPATLMLAGVILAVNYPIALGRPAFWLTMIAACVAYLSIGLIISSLARTQSEAGLTALAYFMIVGITAYLGTTIHIFDLLRFFLVDYHLLQLIHYNLIPNPPRWMLPQLCVLIGLSGLWAFAAAKVFARRAGR